MRLLLCGLFVLAIGAASFGKEYAGNVVKVTDTSITLKVGDKEETFTITGDTKYAGGKKDSVPTKETLSKYVEKAGEKAKAKVETEEKDGKEVLKDGKPVATKISIGGGKKKDS